MDVVQRALEASRKIRPIQTGQLPIFRLDETNDVIFYTPGYLGLVPLPEADRFEMMLPMPDDIALTELRDKLRDRAEAALVARRRWQTTPFRPECLTLYLNNQCNLRCLYCYADATPSNTLKLDLNVISAGARQVAKSCRQKNCPFTLVIHGGGEPTLDRELVEQVLAVHNEVAREYQVTTFRYIATHGAISVDKALWLAEHFDRVGLSCDGPADIQNYQRPSWSGGPTFHLVEQTAYILHGQGCEFHVRTTITKPTLPRQAEIVDYVCRQLSPTAIHLEPVYLGGRADNIATFEPEDATDFVTHFWQARQRATEYNIPLLYAGSRLDAIHGPYCHIFRDVLNLIPDGVATACFKVTTVDQSNRMGVIIGAQDGNSERFVLNEEVIRTLRSSLIAPANLCSECFNQFHCVGECPDVCPLARTKFSSLAPSKPGFRCGVQKTLALAMLLETADLLRAAHFTPNRRNIEPAYANGTALI